MRRNGDVMRSPLQLVLSSAPEQWSPVSTTAPEVSWGVNFGGGVNSSAMLLMLHDRGMRPEWVLFSDTGSERPETYRHVEAVEKWCADVGFPFATVRWVRQTGEFESIHNNCLRTSYLPSKAYGNAGCTFKWKIQPMAKWRKENGHAESVVAIGYDCGETARVRRVQKACLDAEWDPSLRQTWYPLVAWGVDRAQCEARIQHQGWSVVKSSCFLCPNMSADEWQSLKADHPALFAIADEVERKAKAAGNARDKSLFARAGDSCLICHSDGDSDQ